jgi:hypothetical protein
MTQNQTEGRQNRGLAQASATLSEIAAANRGMSHSSVMVHQVYCDLTVGEEIVAEKSELGLRVTVALVLALVGLLMLAVSVTMPNPLDQTMGPGYVPAIMGACTLILSSWEALAGIREWRGSSASNPKMQGVHVRLAALLKEESNWLTLTALLVVSLLLWSTLGSLVGMIAASFSLIWVDRALGLKKGILFAVILSFSLWFLFEQILKVSLE